MSLLKQNITKTNQVNENNLTELKNSKDSNKYKIVSICNNVVHIKKLNDYLSELYYLVFYKNYL